MGCNSWLCDRAVTKCTLKIWANLGKFWESILSWIATHDLYVDMAPRLQPTSHTCLHGHWVMIADPGKRHPQICPYCEGTFCHRSQPMTPCPHGHGVMSCNPWQQQPSKFAQIPMIKITLKIWANFEVRFCHGSQPMTPCPRGHGVMSCNPWKVPRFGQTKINYTVVNIRQLQ